MKRTQLEGIEEQLKKRLDFPYVWGRKQNDLWDKYSNFIYEIREWEILLERCRKEVEKNNVNRLEFLNYTTNRWYNFWSSVAVEAIFTSVPGIVPAYNTRNRLQDFTFYGIAFDHKTSVFPKRYDKDIHYAQKHPSHLITWLYNNQSNQQRQHFANRLFLIVYAEDGAHWKLKAEISLLKQDIENYVANFDHSRLQKFEFQPGIDTFSDIIWTIK